jgi:cytochrome c-type biogenesis protein CcmE
MDLVYLSQRRQRRLWPIVSMIAVVGLTVAVQVTMEAAGSAHAAPRDRKHAERATGQILVRAPAKAQATAFVAGFENSD